MASSWLGDELWKPEILSGAQHDLDKLPAAVRREAMQLLADLLEDPFSKDPKAKMEGYRDRYRLYFYGDRYRFIYEISRQQRRVIVVRVRLRTRHTYSGMRKW